jgi:hypothetical protein
MDQTEPYLFISLFFSLPPPASGPHRRRSSKVPSVATGWWLGPVSSTGGTASGVVLRPEIKREPAPSLWVVRSRPRDWVRTGAVAAGGASSALVSSASTSALGSSARSLTPSHARSLSARQVSGSKAPMPAPRCRSLERCPCRSA